MKESDEYGTTKIQQGLLSLLKEVDLFFTENNIKYSLNGGSLLGAIRHNGFIPWDDDVDIMVDRDNYYRILSESKHCTNFRIERSIWVYRIKGNKKDDQADDPTIDIFVVDNVPDNAVVRRIKRLAIRTLQGMLKENVKYEQYSLPYKVCLFVTYAIGCLFTDEQKHKMYEYISTIGNGSKTNYVSMYNTLYKYIGIPFNPNTMKELERHKFEDITVCITSKYDDYLTAFYGDYMTPVPKEERIPIHMGNI